MRKQNWIQNEKTKDSFQWSLSKDYHSLGLWDSGPSFTCAKTNFCPLNHAKYVMKWE